MTPHSILSNALVVVPITDRTSLSTNLRGVCGVYALYNVVTGNYYIGSSTVCVYTRILDYTQLGYQASRSNTSIVRALVKHGAESFLVLLVSETSKNEAREAEQTAINYYAPAYNQLLYVDRSTGFKHTAETKALLSVIATGRVRSEESKRNQAKTITGSGNHRYGTVRSDEDKARLRTIALARVYSHKPGNAVVVEHLSTGKSTWYRSVRMAAECEKLGRARTLAALKGTKLIDGVRVYYADKGLRLFYLAIRSDGLIPSALLLSKLN